MSSTETVSGGGIFSVSFILNCSDELLESFRVFFFRRGGAMGPDNVMLSVVFEWANFVLAITSGSKIEF